jgi:hypothetical protein
MDGRCVAREDHKLHGTPLRALTAHCIAAAELLVGAHVEAPRVEIRHITLAPSGDGAASH